MMFVKITVLVIFATVLYNLGVCIYVNTHSCEKLKLKHNESYFPLYLKVSVALLAICFWLSVPSAIYLLFYA